MLVYIGFERTRAATTKSRRGVVYLLHSVWDDISSPNILRILRCFMVENHQELNEEMQTLLSWIGDLIDEGEGVSGTELNELYEWTEQILVYHHEICKPE